MAKVAVAVSGAGYLLKVDFPAVSAGGAGFEAIQASAPLDLGKVVDKAWLKAHAKALETQAAKTLRIDIEQIERFRETLLSDQMMGKTIREAVRKAKLDDKKSQALAEKLAAEEFDKRWKLFATVTLPSGFRAVFAEVIKAEEAALRAQLAKEAKIGVGDYSKRPMITIAVAAVASMVGVATGTGPLAVGLALVGGLVSQAKAWVDHRKEIAARLAQTRDAEAGVRSGIEAATKGLDQAAKALETLVAGLKLTLGAAALSQMEKLAGQGAALASLEAPAAAKARSLIETAAKERATLARDLADQAKRLTALKTAITSAQTALAQAAKLSGEGAKAWDGPMKQSEAMLKNIDDALKLLGTLK